MSSLLFTTSISLLACAALLALPARADAEGAAANPSGRPASAPPVLMAQLDSIPTSPAFHMNVTPNVTSDATPPSGSHDSPSPRRPAPAAKAPSATASVADAAPLQGTRPLIAGPSLRPNLAAFVQHPGALSLAGSAPAVSAVPTLAGTASVAALGSAKNARPGETAASSPAAFLAAIAAATSSPARNKAASEPALATHASPSTHAVAAAGSAPATTEADVFADLRARLASKLGATSAGAGKSYVMRVSNQGEPGESVVGTAHVEHVAALTARHAGTHGAAATVDGAASSAMAHTGDWDYTGVNGPETWSRLKPEFDKCGHGERQSPIDIRDGIAVDLEPIQFDYHAGAFSVVDTGHAIEVDVAPGNAITISGHRYELANVHFHRPAEERIDGKQFDMSMHLVHKDAQGHVAVVTVLLERGSAQATVQAVLNNLPLEKNETMHASGTLDPAQWLPAERRYYTYMGSLTTPPCTEGVLWMVLKQPVQVAPAQEAIFARLYPMNARPVQAASGRLIKQSE